MSPRVSLWSCRRKVMWGGGRGGERGHLVATSWHCEEALAVAEGMQRCIGAADARQVALCGQRNHRQPVRSGETRAAGVQAVLALLLCYRRLVLRFARVS